MRAAAPARTHARKSFDIVTKTDVVSPHLGERQHADQLEGKSFEPATIRGLGVALAVRGA